MLKNKKNGKIYVGQTIRSIENGLKNIERGEVVDAGRFTTPSNITDGITSKKTITSVRTNT